MAAAYQAVILAAGRGSRLAEHTREMPKALLPIGPRAQGDAAPTSFLRRQVELLRAAGVHDIVVVVGCLKEMIYDEAKRWDVPLTFVENPTPDMGTSGSLHSFQFAMRSSHGVLRGDKQTLMMDGDIVYHREVLQRLLDAPEESSLLVASQHRGDDEEVLVYGTPEHPRFLGKGLNAELVAGEGCLGEAVGIVKFAPRDHALARQTIDWMLGDPDAPEGSGRWKGFSPARRATEHEELTQRFMRYRKMRCVIFGAELPFMECDDANEYKRVRESLYPRVLELEARSKA
ncbi:MAG TPA: NTP transferase domain-containing protein [Polyangiales bacterium]|jgi:choline kinase|nr:NTP transferase domain-containing protein [Polyangiales bacterium]